MASAVPDAIDWLVANIGALAECALPVVVSDGWPDEVAINTYVAIGVTPDDQEVPTQAAFAQLGGGQEEDVTGIPCLMESQAAGEGAQKTARDAVFVILDAIRGLLRSKPTMDDILQSGAAQVSTYSLRQTPTAVEAGQGRSAEIFFVVTFNHRF